MVNILGLRIKFFTIMGCKSWKKLRNTGLRRYEPPAQWQELTPTQGRAEGTKPLVHPCAWLPRERAMKMTRAPWQVPWFLPPTNTSRMATVSQV